SSWYNCKPSCTSTLVTRVIGKTTISIHTKSVARALILGRTPHHCSKRCCNGAKKTANAQAQKMAVQKDLRIKPKPSDTITNKIKNVRRSNCSHIRFPCSSLKEG